MDLLCEGDGGIVVRDGARGGGVGAGQSNTVVDVEDAGGTARRPDNSSGGNQILLGVDL